MEHQFISASNCAQFDPLVLVSAMASVSKSVCFGITGSTSYINVRASFNKREDVNRLLTINSLSVSLEHTLPLIMSPRDVSRGMLLRPTPPREQRQMDWTILQPTIRDTRKHRSSWNYVTRELILLPFFQEYTHTKIHRLWEGSWEDDAVVFSKETGVAYDPSKVHQITYTGNHHRTTAVNASHPSPQRTPVIFQAGQSPAGKAFSALNAEAIFVGGGKPSDTAPYVKQIREAAAANGRDPNHIKVFP